MQETVTRNRGLDHEEGLVIEIGHGDVSGVDLLDVGLSHARLSGVARKNGIGLPGLSEPETIRHYVRLSQRDYAIDTGIFPLGSCTMKRNARLNEKVARMPGFADLHPLQPQSTMPGALELMARLSH